MARCRGARGRALQGCQSSATGCSAAGRKEPRPRSGRCIIIHTLHPESPPPQPTGCNQGLSLLSFSWVGEQILMGISFLAALTWEVCGAGTLMAAPSLVFWCCCFCATRQSESSRGGGGGTELVGLRFFVCILVFGGKEKKAVSQQGEEVKCSTALLGGAVTAGLGVEHGDGG